MAIRYSPPIGGLIASIGSFLNPSGRHKNNDAIDTGVDGTPLFKEDVISEVMEKLEKRKTEKSLLELQWTLNANFLAGNQFCDINVHTGSIEQLPITYDWLERETFNQIAPLIDTRIANLKKINYMMKVKPATNELSDYDKAEISTSVLQHTQKVTDFESKKNTMIYWNELCGNCFFMSWWDKDKGELIGVEKTIAFDENGVSKNEETSFYEGALDYGLLTPYEVYPESIFKQGVEAQRSIILEQVKTVDDIYDLYGIKVKGSEIETFTLTPVVSGGGLGYETATTALNHHTSKDSAKVTTYFERPSKHKPNGRMIIIVGDDMLVYYGDLPYSQIPIVQVVCKEVAGQFFGKSVIEDLIPRQRAYNGCLNRIHEYIKRTAIGSYIAEEGSVDIDAFMENGQVGTFLEYEKGTQAPTPILNGNLPSEIMQERYNLKSDMEYVAGVSQLMVNGATPSGITSGTAISNLMEIDNTRISLTGDHIRNSVRKLAIQWLEIYKKYATTKRIINYIGTNNIGKAITWCNEDINSYDVVYTTENELLMSEEMQKQRFFDSFNMGLFTDDDGRISQKTKLEAIERMKMGSYSDIMNINSLQIQSAQRENDFFESGIIPEISEFNEHQIHIDEHTRYILQMEFQLLKMRKPNYAKVLEEHIKQHKEAVKIEQQQKLAQIQGANAPILN